MWCLLLVERMLDIADEALSLDEWAFARSRHVSPKAYPGAALRHCSVLLHEMDDARVAGHETTVRVSARDSPGDLVGWHVPRLRRRGGLGQSRR